MTVEKYLKLFFFSEGGQLGYPPPPPRTIVVDRGLRDVGDVVVVIVFLLIVVIYALVGRQVVVECRVSEVDRILAPVAPLGGKVLMVIGLHCRRGKEGGERKEGRC